MLFTIFSYLFDVPYNILIRHGYKFCFSQIGDFGCGDGGWTPLMKIDGSKVSLIWRNILGGVFLRVMKCEQESFRSVETTIESLSNLQIFLSRSLLAEIPLA